LVPRSAEPYVVTKPKPPFPTAWARTPALNIVREGVQRFGLGPLLRSEVQPIVHGTDLLERMGPRAVVFVANHSSHMDTPLILCSLPADWRRRTAVAAAADYFFDTWWRATGSAVAFNTFPIERRGGTLSSTPGDLLGSGWNVVVFPEGTRSPDGWTRPFRLGAAYLAAQYGVPVVPIGIRGSYAAMPRGRGWPVPGRPPVTVRFGEPIHQREGEGVRELGARVGGGRRAGRRGREHLVGVQAALDLRPDPVDRRARGRTVAPGLGLDRVTPRRAPDQDLAPLTP
jgi:1-acyl-sn-glycerol-3-phosphate acyltransferase